MLQCVAGDHTAAALALSNMDMAVDMEFDPIGKMPSTQISVAIRIISTMSGAYEGHH